MTKRIYSLDPEQNAELEAQHAFESRLTGVSVDAYWASADGDEYGDYEEERPFEYSVTIRPDQESEGTIVVIVDAYDEDEAIEKVREIYDYPVPVIVSVEVTG